MDTPEILITLDPVNPVKKTAAYSNMSFFCLKIANKTTSTATIPIIVNSKNIHLLLK
jgi:hypothetical protein